MKEFVKRLFLWVKKTADGKACFVILVMMVVTYSLSPKWQEWVMKRPTGDFLKWLLGIITTHPVLNGTIVLLSCLVSFILLRHWKYDLDNRWYRLLLVLFGLQQLWVLNPLSTIGIVGWLDYRWLWTLCLLTMLLGLVGKWKKLIIDEWNRSKRQGKEDDDNQQKAKFSLDVIDSKDISESKQKYADAIVSHLLGTKLGKQSFAIGVTGAWGTGKSTFLDAVANRLEGKAEIVRFNPWMCRTPEQVTEDFFVTLHRELSSKHSSLSRPIRDYAKYINTATFSLGGGFLSKIALALPQESLMSRKNRLSERFNELEKPVVVFIDDLDRLASDEVFEVLRLIRNTADLSNVFYVVAYDKEYVTEALEGKISGAEAYLEKIFPIEVHQPKVEDSQLYKMLYRELSKQHEYGERFAKALFKKIDQSGRELVIDILNSYRRVMRFARVFLLNMDYIGKAYRNEVKMIDLFWLELLQMYDKTTYDKLADDRELLLSTEGKVYTLKGGIKNKTIQRDDEIDAYKGDKFWKPLTPQILALLFEDRKTRTKYSMRYAENYDKYFTLSVSAYRLSFREFEELFDKGKDPLKTVEGWVDKQKYYSSIIYQFESKEIAYLKSDDVGRYVSGLMELAYQTVNWSNSLIYQVKNILRSKNYLPEQAGWAKGYVMGWFVEKITRGGDLKVVSKILKRLYISTEIDEHGNETEAGSLVITNEDVKMFLRDVVRKYLEQHPNTSALNVLDENNEMGEIFWNCCVCVIDNCQIFEDTKYENVVFDIIMKHFEQKEKPSYSEYEIAFKKMFSFSFPKNISASDYDEYVESVYERRDRQLESYFGSEWDKITQFKQHCFIES